MAFFIAFDPYYVKPTVSGHLAIPRWWLPNIGSTLLLNWRYILQLVLRFSFNHNVIIMFYRYVVIDEVDRMLDMGFSDVVDDILQESYSYGNWNRHFKSWSMYIDFEQVSYFKTVRNGRERDKIGCILSIYLTSSTNHWRWQRREGSFDL